MLYNDSYATTDATSSQTKKSNIVLVTYEKLLGSGIAQIIDQTKDMSMQVISSSTEDVLAKIENSFADLLLLDADCPTTDPFALGKLIHKKHPSLKIAYLMRSATDVNVARALRVGAMGVFLTIDSHEELHEGLRQILAGERRFSADVTRRLKFDPLIDNPNDLDETVNLSVLTERQLEVLRYLARGYSVKHVAKIMNLSEKSVDSHKYRIMNRLGIHDRVELALYSVREGLIEP